MTAPIQAPPPPTATPEPAGASWYTDDAKPYVEAKGWKTPADAISSYQNLEKLQRTPVDRTLVLPETEDAPEWAQVHARLGRPEAPAGYKFEGYEPQDGDLVGGDDGFASVAHKLGLSQKAAGELFRWYQGKAGQSETQTAEQQAETHTAGMEKMRTSWGAAYDQNVQTAKHAVTALGLDTEALEKIEGALGTEWLLSTFHRIGTQLGEHAKPGDPSHTNDNRGGFGMTPTEADLKLQELFRDDAFTSRYFNGDGDAVDRVSKLTQAIAGTALVRPNAVLAR